MRQTKGHSRAAYRALWQQRVQAGVGVENGI